jgi:hypothetical protein
MAPFSQQKLIELWVFKGGKFGTFSGIVSYYKLVIRHLPHGTILTTNIDRAMGV